MKLIIIIYLCGCSRLQAILEYLRGLPTADGHVGNHPVSNPVLVDAPLFPLNKRLTDQVWHLVTPICINFLFQSITN